MPEDSDEPYWWRGLRRADGQGLPPSTEERLAWYERVTRRRRITHYMVAAETAQWSTLREQHRHPDPR